jgi:ABC-type sugar transport system substrate-binding protein
MARADRAVVGLFLRSLENDYQQRLRDDAVTTAQHLGFRVEVLAAQNDPAKQRAQIAAAVNGPQKLDLTAVLVSPVFDDALAEPARSAASAGIGWALLNREADYLQPLRDEFPGLPMFSATPDQVEIGRLQGRQVKAALASGGEVVYLTGPTATSSARRRREGLEEEIAGGLWQVTSLDADWTAEGGRLVLQKWLEELLPGTPAPGVVCAQNDDMALGARQALRDAASRRGEKGLASVPVIGCDGSPGFGQRLVKEKRLLATVAVPSAAGLALEWLARARDGAGRPPMLVTLPVTSVPELHEIAVSSRNGRQTGGGAAAGSRS